MTTTTTNNNATVNAIVIAMSKEEVTMKTKNEIRVMLETVGVEMSNTVFKKTKKDELIAMLEQYLDPSKKVEIVTVEPVAEEPVKEETDTKRKNRIVLSLVIAWVLQTKYSFTGDGRVLFYTPTKRTDLRDVRIASRKRLSKVTGDLLNWVNGTKLEGQAFKDMVSEAYDIAVDAGICHRNGDDIHINKDEWAYCVKLYCKPFMRDSVKKYAEFLNTNKGKGRR